MIIVKHEKDGLKHSIIFQIPEAEVAVDYTKQLQDIAQKVKLPGFRPGKIPENILIQRYGAAAYNDSVQDCVHRAVHKLYAQEKLRPSNHPAPDINIESAELGKDIQVKVDLEVLPDIEVGDLKSLNFKVLKAEITDQEVEAVIKGMLEKESLSYAVTVERAAKQGDQVKIDFEGQLEGVVRSEMCGQAFDLVLGSNTFIPGFEDQLVGVKKGEVKEVSLNFPESYHEEEFAGKPALFKVTVLEVQEIPVLEMNDENSKKIGFETIEQLKSAVDKNLNTHYQKIAWKKSKKDILDVLEKYYVFDVPAGMVENEFKTIWGQFQDQLRQEAPAEKLTKEEEDKIYKKYQQIAQRRVRLGLVLSKIGESHKVEVKEKEFEQEIMYRQQTSPAWINHIIQQELRNKKEPLLLRQIQSELFEDKVLNFMVSQGKVEEIPLSVQALIERPEVDQEKIFDE
jgi:trigger factor